MRAPTKPRSIEVARARSGHLGDEAMATRASQTSTPSAGFGAPKLRRNRGGGLQARDRAGRPKHWVTIRRIWRRRTRVPGQQPPNRLIDWRIAAAKLAPDGGRPSQAFAAELRTSAKRTRPTPRAEAASRRQQQCPRHLGGCSQPCHSNSLTSERHRGTPQRQYNAQWQPRRYSMHRAQHALTQYSAG